MEHIDSRMRLPSRRRKAFHLIRQKAQWKLALDGAFVSLLILFGIIGVLTVLYLQATKAAKQQAENKVVLTANRQVTKAALPATMLPQPEEDRSQFVQILGPRKARTELSIVIDSYDPKAQYTLDLGNGQKFPVDKREFAFSYPGPGIYYPVMEVAFEGERELVRLEKLWIR